MEPGPAVRHRNRPRRHWSEGLLRPRDCSLRWGRRAGSGRHVHFFVVAAATISLALPASTAAAIPVATSRLVPSATKDLCPSASSISKIVGYKVPAPEASPFTSTFDQKRNVSANGSSCSYGPGTSDSSVELAYETLSKKLSLSVIEHDLQSSELANLPANAKYSISRYDGLKDPAFLEEDTGSAAVFLEGIVAVQGQKIAGAVAEQPLPISQLAELTKLAMANYF